MSRRRPWKRYPGGYANVELAGSRVRLLVIVLVLGIILLGVRILVRAGARGLLVGWVVRQRVPEGLDPPLTLMRFRVRRAA